ncbi:MerR family DNA-binding protein [Cryptosporangium arvum]|uniref:MerR family DNA-binding protein n=1 Tax=Cryptosporangium arvum TaxID=80871 RepID=UPI0004B5ED4D|nr:MerR family DNA-binding protein [Cryptosporangium arvum]
MTSSGHSIGDLARATGVAASALRYWEELGLLPAAERVCGQRRYPASAPRDVGQILVLQEAGFSLRDIGAVLASWDDDPDAWRALARRKLAELDERIARAQAARSAVAHALACPHPGPRSCPTAAEVVAGRLSGSSLAESHRH